MYLGKMDPLSGDSPKTYVITDDAGWEEECDDFQEINPHTEAQIEQITQCLEDAGSVVIVDTAENCG